jgi:putative oxidoreductase
MSRSIRSIVFGSATAGPVADLGLLFLRLFAGVALALAHGWNKVPPSTGFVERVGGFGFPAPELFAWMAGLTEFGGGILLAVGLATRPVATIIVLNMIVAVVFGHAGDPFARRELALMFAFVALLFAFVGGGRYAVDRAIHRAD